MPCPGNITLQLSNQNEDVASFSNVHNENMKILQDAVNKLICDAQINANDIAAIKSRIVVTVEQESSFDKYFTINKNVKEDEIEYTILPKRAYSELIDMRYVVAEVRTMLDELILCPIKHSISEIKVIIDNVDSNQILNPSNTSVDPNNKVFHLLYIGKGFTSSSDSAGVNADIDKTSQLINDGEDGRNKFISKADLRPLIPPPAYIQPTLSISSTYSSTLEVGTSHTIPIQVVFVQNDAGALQNKTLKVDNIDQSSLTAIITSNIPKTTTVTSTATYSTGAIKKNVYNDDDDRGQIIAGTLTSNVLSYVFKYLSFFGTSTNARTNQNSFDTTFLLNTGSSNEFHVFIHESKTISEVIDIDALNANITSQYIQQSNAQIQCGNISTTYKHYKMVVATAYSSNHRHKITLQ